MNFDFFHFLMLLALFLLVLIPMVAIIGFHVLLFFLQKIFKKPLYKLPYLKNEGNNIRPDKLISFVDLAYLFKKDSARIISSAIKNGWLVPLYKNSVVKNNNEEFFECYDMYFESNLFNCYDNFINNIYFFKDHVINVKNIYESTLLSDDFFVSEEKITTDENILKIIRNCIKNTYYVNPRITTLKECLNMITYSAVQVVRCYILSFYGILFLEKPNLMYQKEKIETYNDELVKSKNYIRLIDVLFYRSPELFKAYTLQQAEMLPKNKFTANQLNELYFWGTLTMTYNDVAVFLDPYTAKPTPPYQKEKEETNKYVMRTQRAIDRVLNKMSNKNVPFEDVMPLLSNETKNK